MSTTPAIHSQDGNTQFGFRYGAAEVSRCFSHKGSVCIVVRTPRQEIEIYVTMTGLIRIFKGGKKL